MAGRDQFLNFFVLTKPSQAAATTLSTADFNTGAGVATMLAWRIHKIEWYNEGSFSGAADGNAMEVGISTRKSLTVLPSLTDKGTIAVFRLVATVYGAGTGMTYVEYPKVQDFLPPMLIATPNISIYIDCTADFAGMQSKTQFVRIGFTSQKLTESAYREVFEPWNYAN